MTPDADLFGPVPDSPPLPPERWPQLMADLVDLVADEIAQRERVLPEAQRRHLAAAIVTRLLTEHGGTCWYVPKADALERARRNLAMWAEHDGTVDGPHGIRALARQYRLSDQAVWAILRDERVLHRRAVQGRLPGL